jgi:hypothetical protein
MTSKKQSQVSRTITKLARLVADLIIERDKLAAEVATLKGEPAPKPVREIINQMVKQ